MEQRSTSFELPDMIRQPSLGTGYIPVLKEKRRHLNTAGEEVSRDYIVQIILYSKLEDPTNCKELEEHVVSSLEDIDFPRFWDSCCDRDLDVASKKQRSLILHRQASRMEFKTYITIDRLGMLPNNLIPYVYCNGFCAGVKSPNIHCMFAHELPAFKIDLGIGQEEQLGFFRKIMEFRPGVSDLMFCLRLLAVLKPLLQELGYPPQFIGMVYGEFGSGKTELSKFMFQASNLQMKNFIRDNSIPLRKAMEFWNGHVLILDDFHPAEGHWNRKQKDNLDLVARYADKGDGALVVATGEMLAGSASLQDRMIPVLVEKEENISQKLDSLWQMKDSLEALIWRFAKLVYDRKDLSIQIIRKFYENWSDERQKFRIARNKKFLYLAMCVFIKLFPEAEYNGLDKQIMESLNFMETNHISHMEKIHRMASGEDWSDEVFLMFQEQQIDKQYGFKEINSDFQEVVIENNKLYITSTELERRLREYLSMKINVKKVAEHLDNAGILETDNSRARTKKLKGRYYYVINRARLELYHNRKMKR